MSKTLRVLIIEDSPDDAALLIRELQRGPYTLHYRQVCTPEETTEAIEEPWDIVISDWSMPRFSGLGAYRMVREHDVDLPFIIVSGTISEEIAVEALKAGVHDFMTKGKFARLWPAIERELREAEARKHQRHIEAQLDRKHKELERSEHLLRVVLESVPDGVIVADEDGKFVLWNPAALKIAEVERADPSPESWPKHVEFFLSDKITPCPPESLPFTRALRGKAVDNQEFFLRSQALSDGAWLSVNARPLQDNTATLRGGISVFRNISKEKAAQEQLMISDRMASIGLLAAGLAHEINNPLAAVMGNIELTQQAIEDHLQKKGDISEARELLADAHKAAERVRQIVKDLKIFSRHEEVKPTAVDIKRVIGSSLRMAQNEIRHRARVTTEYSETPLVLGSESRLGQVFLNLLINAAQATPEGNAEQNLIRVTTGADRLGRVIVSVSDTGPGIAPEVLRRLFTPFVTTKPVSIGTGLGLAICQRIINDMGGEISVESGIGRGTTFRLTLPAAMETPSAPPAPVTNAPPKQRARILVVDDDPILAKLARHVLEREHDVTLALRASEALERIQHGESFDIILCDLMMPQLTGMELYDEIQKYRADYVERMIFLTGGAFTPDARAFLERVDNQRIEKPFGIKQLRALLNERLR